MPQIDEQHALDRGAMRSSMTSTGSWQSKISSGDYSMRYHKLLGACEQGAEPRGAIDKLTGPTQTMGRDVGRWERVRPHFARRNSVHSAPFCYKVAVLLMYGEEGRGSEE